MLHFHPCRVRVNIDFVKVFLFFAFWIKFESWWESFPIQFCNAYSISIQYTLLLSLLIENYSFFQWTNSFRDEHEVNLNSTKFPTKRQQTFLIRVNFEFDFERVSYSHRIEWLTSISLSEEYRMSPSHGRDPIRSELISFHSTFLVFLCYFVTQVSYFFHTRSPVSSVHSSFYIPILQIQGFAVIWHRLKWLLIWRWQIWDFRAELTIVVVRWKKFICQYSLVFCCDNFSHWKERPLSFSLTSFNPTSSLFQSQFYNSIFSVCTFSLIEFHLRLAHTTFNLISMKIKTHRRRLKRKN